MALPHAPSANAAARADRDLRKIPTKGRVSIHERPKHVEARTEDLPLGG